MTKFNLILFKYRNLILSIFALILLFLICWYNQQLFSIFFVFALILKFGVLGLYFFCFVLIVLDLKKRFSVLNLICLILLILPIVILPFLPVKMIKTSRQFHEYNGMYLEVVEMVKNGEIITYEYKNAKLPEKYKFLSSDGEIYIYQNDESAQEISFWVVRGFLSGSEELVYSSDGIELIYKNKTGHPIRTINKINENWYYVITDY